MTFQQILNRVSQNIWGNTAAPAAHVAMLEGEYGIIAEAHRQIQQDYNYWFMQEYASVESEVGVQAYNLPTDYKQMITALWQTVDEYGAITGFSNPLMPLGLGDAQKYFWKSDDSDTNEYPGYYEIFGNNIVIYPDPSEIRALHIYYWKFLPRPTDFDLSDDLNDTQKVFKPSIMQQYFSPELLQLIADTGRGWKGKFTNCSIRVCGCNDAHDEVLIAYNDTVNIYNETELNIEISGTANVFEIMSNDNQKLYFNGTMGILFGHPIQITNNYFHKESILRMQHFNIMF